MKKFVMICILIGLLSTLTLTSCKGSSTSPEQSKIGYEEENRILTAEEEYDKEVANALEWNRILTNIEQAGQNTNINSSTTTPVTSTTTNATDKTASSTTKPSQPDLTVKDVSFEPGSVKPGDKISVTFTIVNQGGTASGPFSNRISLATTTYGTDISLGNYDMASLNPNESNKQPPLSISMPTSVLPVTYYVTVYTDGFTKVDEIDEMNNIGSAASLKVLPATTVPPAGAETNITINSSSVTVTTLANNYASYTYTVSGKASGPTGSNFAMSAVVIDPKIGEVPLTGPQNATGGWSYTKDPNYQSVRFEEKPGEPGSITWTITGSGKEAASYLFTGCVIEFRAILRLNGVNIQRQTTQVKAN